MTNALYIIVISINMVALLYSLKYRRKLGVKLVEEKRRFKLVHIALLVMIVIFGRGVFIGIIINNFTMVMINIGLFQSYRVIY